MITFACLTRDRAKLNSGSTFPAEGSPAAKAAAATASALATAAAPGATLPGTLLWDALVPVLRARCRIFTYEPIFHPRKVDDFFRMTRCARS